MPIVQSILAEHYINITDKAQMVPYIDYIWDMLDKAYAYVGGFKSAKNKEDLIKKSSLWKMVRRNGKIVCIAIYTDKLGRKAIAKAYDESEIGKTEVHKLFFDDARLKRGWGEFSHAPEYIMLKYGARKVPNKYAQKILGPKKPIISFNPDGFHYTRLIQGEPKEKIILGYIEGFDIETEE